MKNHLKSIVIVFALILGLCAGTSMLKAATAEEINDTVKVGTKILAKDGPDVSVVIPEPPEVAPSKVLTVTKPNDDGSVTCTSSYKAGDKTVSISRTTNADGTVNESVSTNDGKAIESRGVVLDGTEQPGDTPDYTRQTNFSGATTKDPVSGGSSTTGVVTNGYGVPQYFQTIAIQKAPDMNDPNKTWVTTIVSKVSLDGSKVLGTTFQENIYTIVKGKLVATVFSSTWTGIGDKVSDKKVREGVGGGTVAIVSSANSDSTFCDTYPNDPICKTDTGTGTIGGDVSLTIEDFCKTNPEDISCTGAKTFCETHPTSPICVGIPDYCDLHPADILCTGIKSFCETHPSDPSCVTPPTFCESHPADTSCTATPFCVANPLDPSCSGSSVCSISNADIIPNNKMVYVGSKLSITWESTGCDTCKLTCTDSSKCGVDTTQIYTANGTLDAKPQAGYYAYKITCTGPGLNNTSEKVLSNGAYDQCSSSQPDNCLRIRRPFIFETSAFLNALIGKK